MTRKSTLTLLAAACAVTAFAARPALGAPVNQMYWDVNGTTAGAGATPSGAWNGTNAFFNSDSTGGSGGAFTATTDGTDDVTFVAGPSTTAGAGSGNNTYTVTVSGTQTVNGIIFTSTGYGTLTGGTIDLGADGISAPKYAFGTANNSYQQISSAIVLEGNQTWTNSAGAGGLSVNGGISAANASTVLNVVVNNTVNLSNLTDGAGTLGVVASGGTTLNISGTNSLSGGLTSSSSGTLNLSGTFTGNLTSQSGVYLTGTVTGVVTISSGNFTVENTTLTSGILNGNMTGSAGAIWNTEGLNQSYTGNIGSSVKLTKSGAGTLTLTGSDTSSGATGVSTGTLSVVDSTNSTSPSSPGVGTISFGSGTLQLLANGDGAMDVQTLSYINPVLANQGANATIDVGRSSGTGGDKVFALKALTTGVTNNVLNLTNSPGDGSSISFTSLALSGTVTGTSTLNPTSANVTIVGNVSDNATATNMHTLILDGTSGGNVIGGAINGSGNGTLAVTKSDSSTWALNGGGNYTGATSVIGGTLLINGSLPAASAVSVGGGTAINAPTLGGDGTVNGNITINAAAGGTAGIIAPGNGTAGNIANLTLTNNLTDDGTSMFDLSKSGVTLTNDELLMSASKTLTLGGGELDLNFTGSGFSVGDAWTIASGFNGLPVGVFGMPVATGLSDAFVPVITYNSGSVVVMLAAGTSPVPEPASLGLLAVGAIGLLTRKRRTK